MNILALYLGYTLMAAGGLFLVAFAVGLVLDKMWRTIKNVRSMTELRAALRLYESKQ